jgi:glycosyltransferase involved in cell wall biosynthesis
VLADACAFGIMDGIATGGNAYDYAAVSALSATAAVSVDRRAVLGPRETELGYMLRLSRHRPNCDAAVLQPYPLVFGPSRVKYKRVAMIHHIDERKRYSSVGRRLFFSRWYKRLRQCDMVITVARHWQEHLIKCGCRNVKVIYNSFDTGEFDTIGKGGCEIREKYDLPLGKPLIHIGNAAKQKGVDRVYEALKGEDYCLVMTGAVNRAADVPAPFLSLPRRDYLELLSACDVVVCMSLLPEGWNRVAHEALLCGTPVIGSGSGGMRELLDGAGQITASSFGTLSACVKEVLERREHYAAAGFAFARKFDLNYFERAWRDCLSELLDQ